MPSNPTRRALLLSAPAVLLATTAASGDPKSSPEKPAVLPDELLVPKNIAELFEHPARTGEEPIEILKSPGKVEAFRISPHIDLTDEKRFAGYRVLSGPDEIETNLAAEIAAALLDPKSYDFPAGGGERVGCGFAPGIIIRFTDKPTRPDVKPFRVAVFLCFLCNGMDVCFSSTESKTITNLEPGRARFVKLMKRAFPKDKVVQALKEETPAEPPPGEESP